MVPDTHYLFQTEDVRPKERLPGYDLDRASRTIQAKKGSCILFDFRLKHRGLGNNSQKPRPLM
jgi:ectoine hydroxylase-related dioxygenase (phytanoyl-CoA dioxygenase family)